MGTSNLITRELTVSIKTVADAPDYNLQPEKWEPIKITEAIVVKEGMENGLPTVDLQCEDVNGNKYLIFTTAKIINMLSAICMQNVIDHENLTVKKDVERKH